MLRLVTRGFGPPRQSAELVEGLTKLELPRVSSLSGAPLGLKSALLTGVMWCLWEIELSLFRVDAVTLDKSSLKVTINLPTSKMATPTRNLANTPALADVKDDFLEVAAGTLKPRASPTTVRAVLDTVLARPGRSFLIFPQLLNRQGCLLRPLCSPVARPTS